MRCDFAGEMHPRMPSQLCFCCPLHERGLESWVMQVTSPAALVSLAKSCATCSNRAFCHSTRQAVNSTGTTEVKVVATAAAAVAVIAACVVGGTLNSVFPLDNTAILLALQQEHIFTAVEGNANKEYTKRCNLD